MPQRVPRAALYRRISKEAGEDKYSLSEQEAILKAEIARRGLSFREEHNFCDTFSGAYWRERKDLQRMLAASKHHEFDYLFIVELDRLAREPNHMDIISEELEYNGVEIVSLNSDENIKKDDPMSEITRQVYATFAKEERKKIRNRTQRGIHGRIKSQKIGPRRQPRYGYDWDNPAKGEKNRYVINPVKSEVVKRICTCFDEGMTIRSIAAMLTNERIPTPDNKEVWKRQTILDTHKCEDYTGVGFEYKAAHSYVPKRGRVKEVRPREEWIPLAEGLIPPLISRDMWERNQIRLARNRELSFRNEHNPEEMLCRGLVYCGYCGAKMTKQRNNRHHCLYYMCHKRRNALSSEVRGCENSTIVSTIIDAAAWDKAVEIIQNPALLKESLKKPEDQSSEQLDSVTRLLEKVNAKIQNLTETLEEGVDRDTRQLITGRLSELVQKREGYLEERDLLLRSKINHEDVLKAYDRFALWCEENRDKLSGEVSWERKRDAVEKLGIVVIVWRADHTPHYVVESCPPQIATFLHGSSLVIYKWLRPAVSISALC